MSVAIVGHQVGNMLVKVMNLEDKRYVESFLKNEKSYLLRNVIDKIICHQSNKNGLKRSAVASRTIE